MLCGGDEVSRTKKGNNNTYCQDNELTWHSWQRTEEGARMFDFTCKLIAFRAEHPIFHRPRFFQGKPVIDNLKDINWLRPDGVEMDTGDWDNEHTRAFGVLLCGDDMGVFTFEGQPIRDDTFYLVFNAYHEDVAFLLPGKEAVEWQMIINTANPDGFIPNARIKPAGSKFSAVGRSLALFRQVVGSDEEAKQKPVRARGKKRAAGTAVAATPWTENVPKVPVVEIGHAPSPQAPAPDATAPQAPSAPPGPLPA